ncbi:DUF2637 domain-containing protein [Streptomyces sp. SCA3-4]|uniref:DUF2637 domain-containing protein n=1 Tax=Streptomyces sichuanensis TaxID=2871810 RepID=UPI001CE3A5B0|nr:DUF2637 domain-containing protein [Streptomyces sichuanensis]MCA6094023.1 DUF2637 domain-containing protein [Streptomyces sichuanensis]
MSDLVTWQEQRRQDRLADRQQSREDRRLEREQDRADRAEARADKRRDKADRAERRRARRAWLVDNGALICTVIVMLCAIVPALASQFLALSTAGVGPLLAALLSVMLEGAAWAATLGAAHAAQRNEPTGRYRAATWTCAVIAAAVNGWHGTHDYGLWLGVVLAAASLFAVGMWELHLHGTNAPSHEERDKARHTRRRRRHHRKVCQIADRLISAAPYGDLGAEEAFRAAWQVHHGTTPGLTADLLSHRLTAEASLGEVIESAADTTPQRVAARLWSGFDHPLPILGPVSPLPIANQEETAPSSAKRSRGDLQESTHNRADRAVDEPTGSAPDRVPIRPARFPLDGCGRRRPTGRVPEVARTPQPSRSWEELLTTARTATAEWADEDLTAEALRKTLRTAPSRARALREALKAERKTGLALAGP